MGKQQPFSGKTVGSESGCAIPSGTVYSWTTPPVSDLLDLIPSIVLVFDPHGRIVRLNQTGVTACGYDRDSIEGRLIWETLTRPQDTDAARQGFRAIAAGAHTDRRPAFLRDCHGEDHLYNWYSRVVRDDSGRPTYVISTGFDMSEERRVERTLRQLTMTVSASIGDTFFRTLVTALTSALEMEFAFIGELIRPDLRRVRTIAVYRDGQIIDNFEFDLKGKPCSDVVARTFCIYESGIRTTFPNDPLLEALHAESYVGIPLQDSARHVIGMIAVIGRRRLQSRMMVETMLSVTAARASAEMERRNAGDVLMRTNRALQTLSEVNRTIVRADHEEQLVETVCRSIVTVGNYHSAWIGISGMSLSTLDEAGGRFQHAGITSLPTRSCYVSSKAMLKPPRDMPCPTGGLCHEMDLTTGACLSASPLTRRCFESGQAQSVQDVTIDTNCTFLKAHGNGQRYRAMIALPLIHGGQTTGVLCVRAFEPQAFGPREAEVLARVADELAYALSALKTRSERERAETELTQRDEQLRQAQKLEAVGTLAGGMAHDFKNLLSAISGYTSLAKRTMASEHPAVRSLELVEQAAAQADGIIKSLLTFCQKAPAAKKPVDFGALISDSVRFLRHVLPSRIEVREEVADGVTPGDGLWVMGDQNQLKQVILNLAINSRDAIAGSGTLTLSVTDATPHEAGQPGWIRLIVHDTGTGMSPEVRKRIFEPFFTTKSPDLGTGLGLAVVHGIVSDHGGTMVVDSAPGEGSTFTLDFPRYRRDRIDEPQQSAVPGQTEGGFAGGGMTVHLLADDTLATSIVAGELRAAGLVVRCIHNLKLASDLLDSASVIVRRDTSPPIAVVDESWVRADPTLARHLAVIGQYLPTVVLADGGSHSTPGRRDDVGGARSHARSSPEDASLEEILSRAVRVERPFRSSDLLEATARAVEQSKEHTPNSETRDDT